jgi:hypothetical protein
MRNQNIFFSDISEIGLAKQPVSHTPTKLSRGAKVNEIRDIKDIAKAVREYVKKKYPNCKFSVSIERYSGGQSMTVSLQEADFNPLTDEIYWEKSSDGNKYFTVNQYHLEKSDKLTPKAISVLKDVRDFYNQFNYNHSDPQTDYFNVRFYETLTIGKWDKGFVQVAKKSKTPRTPRPAPEKGGEQPKYAVGSKIMYKTSRGSESGKVLGSKFLASKDSYLYEIENPRGDTYRIWESNIISEMPQPKEKWDDEQYEMFKNWIENERPIIEELSTKNLFRATSVEDGEFVIENLLSNDRISFTPTNLFDNFFQKFMFNYTNDLYSKKLKYIWVKWSEHADLDTGMYLTWDSFQNKLKTLNLDYDGYAKTKVTIVWENYRAIIDRIDIGKSDGDFDPNREFIGDYLRNQTSAYFWSNFSGERTKEALWRDKEEMPELPKGLFNVGQIVTIKGQTDKYSILSIINYEGKIFYEVQRLVDGGTAYLPETALELAIEDKNPPSEKIELPSTDKRTWNERFNIGDQVKVRWDFSTDMGNGLSEVEYNSNANLFTITQSGEIKDFKRIQNPSGFLYTLNNGKTWEGKDLELALDDETLENKFTFKVGDVFRRNMEDEKPPNTKITYTILSIGEEKTQYRIDYLDKGTNRLSTKSNEKITEEITNDWWIPYETIQEENNSLKEAISLLKDENDAMWDMYVSSEDTNLRKELRETSNGNSTIINDFSADLFFEPEKFMNDYFSKATQKFGYDNSEISKEEFKKIVESEEFINWFGDFRKPVQEAICSKVLKLGLADDKSAIREPLIVYHGTWNKTHFSRFKFKKFPVIYFATNKSYAEWFAKLGTGIIYQCFLDIKYLCDFRPLGASSVTWSELSLFLNKQYGFFLPQKETKNAKLPVWAWIRNDAPNFDLINTIKEQGFTGMAHIEDNPQDILPNGEKNITTAYMIFSPEQAKLVRYVSTGNAFTDIFFMKKGGKVQNALIDRIKNLKL